MGLTLHPPIKCPCAAMGREPVEREQSKEIDDNGVLNLYYKQIKIANTAKVRPISFSMQSKATARTGCFLWAHASLKMLQYMSAKPSPGFNTFPFPFFLAFTWAFIEATNCKYKKMEKDNHVSITWTHKQKRENEYFTGHFSAFFPEGLIRPAMGLVHDLFDRATDGCFHSLLSCLSRKR